MKQRPGFGLALGAIISFVAIMVAGIVVYHVSPHIPMLIGCAFASVFALVAGCDWDTIQNGMIRSVAQTLGSVILLMLIGILVGVWIISGVVPSVIYYGLKMLSPQFFLFSAMMITGIISLVVGSWGAVGAIGLALMGIAHALAIPAPMAAGAIISGAYLGDKVSPLSDSTNLASAVTGVDIFANVRKMLPVTLVALVISAAAYLAIGYGYAAPAPQNADTIAETLATLERGFVISPVSFLPMLLMIGCVLFKIPSAPSLFFGIVSAGILGMLVQGATFGDMLECAFSGYVCESGNELIDTLLTTGGLEQMMYSISMIVCAMMFGGVMEGSGLMDALMQPMLARLGGRFGVVCASLFTAIGVNAILPEQYIAIALPGRMFSAAYDKYGVDRAELTRALGAGGASFSPIVPWNTCGIFMSGVLGVSVVAYGGYAFLNLLMIPLVIIVTLVPGKAGR